MLYIQKKKKKIHDHYKGIFLPSLNQELGTNVEGCP